MNCCLPPRAQRTTYRRWESRNFWQLVLVLVYLKTLMFIRLGGIMFGYYRGIDVHYLVFSLLLAAQFNSDGGG
uniref:Uncharacterized protein n=1 Tax=Kalanchoe fedtschenkoi TaxID=63787 RepID=A0A7N0VKQ1_KALFE